MTVRAKLVPKGVANGRDGDIGHSEVATKDRKCRMAILQIAIRHLVVLRRVKLGSCAGKRRLFCFRYSPQQVPPNTRSHTGNSIDSSTRNLSLVIDVFGGLENGRITAFEIVEVCGVGTVVPNNGTTINKVRIA